jgi:hypothetical protein
MALWHDNQAWGLYQLFLVNKKNIKIYRININFYWLNPQTGF